MALAHTQILAGTAAVVPVQVTGQDGEPTAASGTVTVGATRGDGTAALEPGTVTQEGAGTGLHTVALPPTATATPDALTLTWTDDGNGTERTTLAEVVGGFYASAADIRASDATLADVVKYPLPALHAARRVVETEFERITGRAFVPRYARRRLRAAGRSLVLLPDADVDAESVRLWTVGSDGALTEDTGVLVGDGMIYATTPSALWCSDVVVSYVHGRQSPPADVLGAFFTRVRDVANRPVKGVPDRTATFTAESGGTFSLIVPGVRGSKTGIPDVDVVLSDYVRTEAMVA